MNGQEREFDINTKYNVDQMNQLIGGEVVGVAVDCQTGSIFGEEYFGLVVKMPDGGQRVMWIWQDGEKNGPGSVTVEQG